MRKTVTLTVLLSCLLISCKKDNQIENTNKGFPIDLYGKSISLKSKIKVYTRNGEITNVAVKNRFELSSEFFKYGENKNNLIPTTPSLTFLSKDSVSFGGSSYKFSYVKTGGQFLFYSIEFPGNYANSPNDFLKFTAERIPYPYLSGGYDFLTREVRVAHGSYKKMNFSVLAYYRKIDNLSSRGYFNTISGILFNEFDVNRINKLGIGDTFSSKRILFKLRIYQNIL